MLAIVSYLASMTKKQLRDLLKSFPFPEKDEWRTVATSEIDGKDPQTLSSKSADGITIQPYYDKIDAATAPLTPSQDEFLGARAWHNMPRVTVRSVPDPNKIILDHLMNGADGVLLDITRLQTVDWKKILTGVDLPYCSIGIRLNAHQTNEAKAFVALIKKLKLAPETVKGFLLWDTVPKDVTSIASEFKALHNFIPFVLHTHAETEVSQLLDLISQGKNLVDQLIAQRMDTTQAFHQIGFSAATTTAFFEDIARMKALRLLWRTVARAYQLSDARFFLHAYSDAWLAPEFAPHGNMLKSTTAALAAVCGGCDALTVLPENEDDATMNRIARNVSNVIREESHLNKVADPTAGSYFLEHFTSSLVLNTWRLFQNRHHS
jgi:methylmalonyl-CoA mutase